MKINLLIIGAGMYVCGRGTAEYGTVLPAVCEWLRRKLPLGNLYLAATSFESIKIAKEKLNALNASMGTDLVLKAFPNVGEVAAFDHYKRVLETISKPACAIIAVPDHLHSEIGQDCLNSGLHVLMVKPLAPKLDEAKRLLEVQRKNLRYGAVEFHKRFDRSNLKMKEMIQKGNIGDPLYFLVEYSQRKIIPSQIFAAWVKNTNVFQYLGVHYVDIIYFVTRAFPARVMAMGQYGWCKKNGFHAFDSVHATIEWRLRDGKTFLSYLMTNWIDPNGTSAMSDQRIKVIGTAGRYEADQKRRGITIVTDTKGIEEPNPDFCAAYLTPEGLTGYKGYGIESIHTFMKDVLDLEIGRTTLKHLESTRATFEESLPSTAVVEAANQSLKQHGQWVNIDYQP